MTKSYVKDPNGKYMLVEKEKPQEQGPSEAIAVLEEAVELLKTCREMLVDQKK